MRLQSIVDAKILSLILSNDSSFSLIRWNRVNVLILFAFGLFSMLLRLTIVVAVINGMGDGLLKLICVDVDKFIGDNCTWKNCEFRQIAYLSVIVWPHNCCVMLTFFISISFETLNALLLDVTAFVSANENNCNRPDGDRLMSLCDSDC